MRTIAVSILVIALALLVLGWLVEALAWVLVIGLVLLAAAVVAGIVGFRRASTMARDRR